MPGISQTEDGNVRIPVERRFERHPRYPHKFTFRPYAILGEGSEAVEIAADFGPIGRSESYKWYFKIQGEQYPVLSEGIPVLNERNHHIFLKGDVYKKLIQHPAEK